jgi:hypothetical protein
VPYFRLARSWGTHAASASCAVTSGRLRGIVADVARLIALLLLALMAGCACADIGCYNTLRVQLNANLERDVPYTVNVCVDDRCATGLLEPQGMAVDVGGLSMSADGNAIEYMLGEVEVSDTAHVTFALSDDDGTLLAEFDDEVERSAEVYQGGWPCGPSCWYAEIAALPVE